MTLNNEATFARLAMGLMEKHGIAPSPEHYAVWYSYSSGKNKELIREIEYLIKSKIKFTAEISSQLHRRFIAVHDGLKEQKELADAAANSQKLLSNVLKVISDFSGETKNYNQNIDQYIDDISQDVADAGVKDIVKQLVQKTATLKQSGEKLNAKLEASSQEIVNLRKNLEEVTIEAQRDFLTGAYNRKTFEKLFDEQLEHIKETKGELCLMMLDIDHFKKFNDRYGHLIGDEVLKTVARTLTDTLKGRDIVARFGGEEFVMMLPDTPIEGALRVGDIIRTAIASKELKRKDTGESFGAITISMGVARYRPESDTLVSLIKRADEALYKSKNNGRNQVTREA